MPTPSTSTLQLDLRGLRCPLPLLRLKMQLAQLPAGSRVLALSSDPGSAQDIPRFLAQAGHELLAMSCQDEVWSFDLRKRLN